MYKNFNEYKKAIIGLVHDIKLHAPALVKDCVLGGSTPISCDHLAHVVSLDLDWHTKEANASPRKGVEELKKHFGKKFQVIMADHEYGMYKSELDVDGTIISIDVFSNFENQKPTDFTKSKNLKVEVVSLGRYLETKIMCLEERQEVKDLYHICAMAEAGIDVSKSLKGVDPLTLQAAILNGKEDWKNIKQDLLPLPGCKGPSEKIFLNWLELQEKTVSEELKNEVTGIDIEDEEQDWDIEM